jgi:hypothetical protein
LIIQLQIQLEEITMELNNSEENRMGFKDDLTDANEKII